MERFWVIALCLVIAALATAGYIKRQPTLYAANAIVQIEQDFALCASKFPELLAHPMGAQFMADGSIALFEFKMTDEGVKIATEKHYKLVAPDEVTPKLLNQYKAGSIAD